jgi:multisubunit Na+/H+ antiporter MnhE subunit
MKSVIFVILTLINSTPQTQHGIALKNAAGSYKIEATGPQNDYRVKPGTYVVHIETDAAVLIHGIEICEGDSIEIAENTQITIK